MKKTFLYSAIAVLAVSACSVQNPEQPADVQGDLIYREFSAVISDDPATKVTFGEGSTETGKVSAQWQVGDEVLLVNAEDATATATVTYANGSTATFGAYTPSDFVPAEAYYPASLYEANGTLKDIATQTYSATAVQIPMTATASAGTDGQDSYYFNFSAEDGYAIVRYSLTGDIKVKSAKLYLTDNASLFKSSSTYTLEMPAEGLQLKSEAQDIYFVVAAGQTKSISLEVISEKPSSSNGTSDYSYFRRKITPIELVAKKVIDMPAAIDFTQSDLLAGPGVWKFGSANAGVAGWKTQNDQVMDGSSNAYYAVVPMKDGGSDTEHNFRTDITFNTGFSVNIGTYRYVAIMSDMEYVARNGGTMPSDATITNGKITFDTSLWGEWHNTGGNQKEGAYSTAIENVNVWYFDMLDVFKASSNSNYAPTAVNATFESGKNFQFKVADLKVKPGATAIVAPSYKVYWIGFFNNKSEISALISETEALVAAENTTADNQ